MFGWIIFCIFLNLVFGVYISVAVLCAPIILLGALLVLGGIATILCGDPWKK